MKALFYVLISVAAICLACLIRRLVNKHGTSTFIARVSSALLDLGMQAEKLPPDLNKAFLDESRELRRTAGRKAEPRALALDLYVRFFMAYSAQMTPYERVELIERSIRKARHWQEHESIEETCDDFVDTIKEIFIDEMAACQMTRADRSETVSRVMSL